MSPEEKKADLLNDFDNLMMGSKLIRFMAEDTSQAVSLGSNARARRMIQEIDPDKVIAIFGASEKMAVIQTDYKRAELMAILASVKSKEGKNS